jgi:predicted Fe-Mo cluster-binding NifX family protein
MKVGIPATDQTIEAEIDPRFGRCPYFVIVDTETMDVRAISNSGGKAGEGAGIQAAQALANEGVEAVIGPNFGPNAFMTLKYAEIKIFSGKGIISQVIEQFKKGELPEMQDSNVPKKAGQFTR